MMAVNLCAAHNKTVLRAAHEVLLACFFQSCSTRRWILCNARNIAGVLYMKLNSCVICEFGLSQSTKIEEHTRVLARKCQLRHELYCMYSSNLAPHIYCTVYAFYTGCMQSNYAITTVFNYSPASIKPLC